MAKKLKDPMDQITGGQDLTKGPIKKQIWSLAWPMMLSVFFYTLYNLVDTYWVSKVSADAIAAVSISQITLFIMIAFGFGITIGSGVVMSMHIGAKDKKEAERVLGQSFVLAAIAGIFFTLIALLFREELLLFSGATGSIIEPATQYFTITAAGSILFFILVNIMFAFNAQGDTFTLTKLFALSTLLNVIIDPILIFGLLGVPALGVSGAAIATLISQFVFIIIAIRSLSSSKRMIRFQLHNLSLKAQSVKEVLNIGIPASLTQVIQPVGLAALTFIAALGFQESGAIAFSLGFRVEFFAFLPAAGFGFGAMAMIGQNIGAGNKERAKEVFAKALKYAFISATALGIAVALLATSIIQIFTTDPIVTEYAKTYMWMVALSYGFLAAMFVEANSFQAIDKSWNGFWLIFLRFAVVSIPLSYAFTQIFSFSIEAIWISMIAGNVVSALIGYIWFQKTIKKVDPKKALTH